MAPPTLAPTRLPPERLRFHEARGEWPHPSLSDRLAERMRESPDRVLFVAGSTRWSARDLAGSVLRLATGLRSLGVGAGDVVSWQLPNWLEGVALHFALDRLGAVSNPILPIYREREVGFVVRQARARILVVPGLHRGFDHRDLAAAVRQASPTLETVLVARARPAAGQQSFDDLMATEPDPALPPSPLGPHDVSSVFYTSGTTAEPKGVLHSSSTLGSFLRTHRGIAGGPDEVGLLSFPLTHIGGVVPMVAGPVASGGRAVFLDVFDAEACIELIEREKVTSAGAPTPILQAILGAPGFAPERMASVRLAGMGGTDVPPELMREVERRFGAFVYRSYGMTECPMATAGVRGDPSDRVITTDGRPVAGVVARVVAPDGAILSAGEEGEVELFGPQMCLGYLDAASNEDAFTEDGFLRTGDLAIIDSDGFLRITGRKKDIIIRKGENLSAKAIEDDLHDHPDVAEVAVIGVPDRTSGEVACACVVLRPGAAPLSLENLRRFMLDRGVMPQKIPERLEPMESLPRNATGKVLKHRLRARFDERGRP